MEGETMETKTPWKRERERDQRAGIQKMGSLNRKLSLVGPGGERGSGLHKQVQWPRIADLKNQTKSFNIFNVVFGIYT